MNMEQNHEIKRVNVYNLIIIDESGSMSSIYDQALSGINETLNTIRLAQEKYSDQKHFVSVVSFEGHGPQGIKTRRDREAISKIQDLSKKEYVPGGCTPLYDAIGISVNHLHKCIEDDAIVLVTIITDGYENASCEYSGKAVKELVSRQREMGWTFAYIGANQDAVEVARDLNICNAMNFDATPEGTVNMSVKYRKSMDRVMFGISTKSLEARDMEDFFKDEDKPTRTKKGDSIADALTDEILKK